MPNNRYDHTAAPLAFGPNQPPQPPPGVAAAFMPRREPRETVVTADNRSAPPMVIMVAAMFILVMGFLAAFALHRASGLSFWITLLLILPGVGYTGYKVLILLNGDYIAAKNIVEMEKTERLRTQAGERAWDKWMLIQDKFADAQLTDARTRQMIAENERKQLEADLNRPVRIQSNLNRVEGFVPPEQVEAVEAHLPEQGVVKLPTMVEARPDPFKSSVLQMLTTMHDNVDPEGRIKMKIPWSKRGGWKDTDAEWFLKWSALVANQTGHWTFRYSQKEAAWFFNVKHYKTPGILVKAYLGVAAPLRD